jgi:Rieske 2Fe-2S family protein
MMDWEAIEKRRWSRRRQQRQREGNKAMDQSPAQRPFSPLLDHCPPSLPARYYYDPNHFALEQKAIWRRNWAHAGRKNDFQPMTVKRVEIAGQNLIVIRDAGGKIACFHNTCRHRGAELCRPSETRLKSKLVTCPYHQWSYDLEGKLVRTPFVVTTPDFHKEEHGLFSVAVREWNGFVFVCLADDPPDFARAPDMGADALANWPMAELQTGHSFTTELDCNWKIFWENYNECLHCPGIHPELCDLVPVYGRGYMAPNEDPAWKGAPSTVEKTLKPGARSWTVNGKASGPEFPGLTPEQREAGHFFVTLYPTLFVVAHVDYVRAVSLRPLGPTRTELRIDWLFPAETLATPGFDLMNTVNFAKTVLLQDGAACEMNQRGLASEKYTQGTLMPQEFDVFRFQQWVRKQLESYVGDAP